VTAAYDDDIEIRWKPHGSRRTIRAGVLAGILGAVF
jgi:hypothetical protein